ncbi:MAG: hypothetical protein ABFD92_16790 [Planctomycetaceae bacterium]|nr:hypothetical protein [Planctomycetaceae bacterium]
MSTVPPIPTVMEFDPQAVHPLYSKLLPSWLLNRDFAEMHLHVLRDGEHLDKFGGDTGDNVEPAAQYAWRRNASFAMDHCQDLINLRVDNLFRSLPSRHYDASAYKEIIDRFVKDVDGAGTSMDKLMRRVVAMHYINGVDVVVDKKRPPEGSAPKDRAEEAALGLRPYVHVFSAIERMDWAVDYAGKYLWARYRLGAPSKADETDAQIAACQYLTMTAGQWRLYTVSGDGKTATTVESGTIAIGQVPVVTMYFKESMRADFPKVPLSLLSRIAPIARFLLNLISQIQIDIYRSIGFMVATGVGSDQIPSTITPMGCWALPEGASITQIAAEFDQIRGKIEFAQMLMESILRIGKLTGNQGDLQSRAASGVQVAVERTDLDNEMRSTAGAAEEVEREIIRLMVSRELGKPITADELGYSVEYNKKYVLTSVSELIAQARAWVSVGVQDELPSTTKAMFSKIVDAMINDDDPMHEKAMKEIEAATFTVVPILGNASAEGQSGEPVDPEAP